jgi:hypothetical protein
MNELFKANRRQPFVQELVEAGVTIDVFEAAALGNMVRIKEILGANPDRVRAFSSDGFQRLFTLPPPAIAWQLPRSSSKRAPTSI